VVKGDGEVLRFRVSGEFDRLLLGVHDFTIFIKSAEIDVGELRDSLQYRVYQLHVETGGQEDEHRGHLFLLCLLAGRRAYHSATTRASLCSGETIVYHFFDDLVECRLHQSQERHENTL